MRRERARHLVQKKAFQELKPDCGASVLEKLFTKIVSGSAPDLVEGHDRSLKLSSRTSQEGESAPRPEVRADHRCGRGGMDQPRLVLGAHECAAAEARQIHICLIPMTLGGLLAQVDD